MIKLIIVILSIFGAKSLAKPPDCPTIIKNFDAGDSASLNSNYTVAGMIAHSIHSLTIQDIDYYFPNDKVCCLDT